MSTTKSRLNISLPDDIRVAISDLARRDNMPAATKAERLIEVALELEEDRIWDDIASLRDTPDAKFLTHNQVFNA